MITVVQPDPLVPLERFGDWLPTPVHVVPLWEEPVPTLADCGDGVIVLGGRQDALDVDASPWLPALRALLREAIAAKLPVLGICLGHQILADALGGELSLADAAQDQEGAFPVRLTSAGMEDPLLGALAAGADVFWTAQSHHDAVTTLPAGAVLLATSDACAVQAFRCGSAVGVQFHPEASPQLMARWTEESTDGTPERGQAMLAEMTAHDQDVRWAGQRIAERFAALTGASGAGAADR